MNRSVGHRFSSSILHERLEAVPGVSKNGDGRRDPEGGPDLTEPSPTRRRSRSCPGRSMRDTADVVVTNRRANGRPDPTEIPIELQAEAGNRHARTSFRQKKPSANPVRDRHSMPRNRSVARKVSPVNQGFDRCEGKASRM
jgi:hypothetical protein